MYHVFSASKADGEPFFRWSVNYWDSSLQHVQASSAYPTSVMKVKISLILAAAMLAGACSPKPREGEAFLVLKSDEIRPLGDITVTFLNPSFAAKFSALRQNFESEKSQSLNNTLGKNPEAQLTLNRMNEEIGRLQKEKEISSQVSKDQRALIGQTVDQAFAKDQSSLQQQLESEIANLHQIQEQLSHLEDSAQARFDAESKQSQGTIKATHEDVKALTSMVTEFDSVSKSPNAAVEKQSSINERAKKRESELPRLVAQMLNQSIRTQKLQTPLLDEDHFYISASENEFPLGSRPTTYLNSTYVFESLGKEYQRRFNIPEELLEAKNLSEAMQLVREYYEFQENSSALSSRLSGLTQQRGKEVQPWINLNSERIAAFANKYGVSTREENRSYYSRSDDSDWPPRQFQAANNSLSVARDQEKSANADFAALSFEKFKSGLTLENKGALESQQAKVSHLESQIAALPATKNQRLDEAIQRAESEATDKAGDLQERINTLTGKKDEFMSETDRDAQFLIKKKFVENVMILVRKQTQSEQRTDMAGKFTIPKDAAFVWASKIRDNGEKVFWLRKVQFDTVDKMLLSNSTQTGDGNLNWLIGYSLN
jgi:hypothetical protein